MRWEGVLRLLPALKQGLEEVEAFFSEALLQSTKPKASVKELNFYLTSGMGLYSRYRCLMQKEDLFTLTMASDCIADIEN